MMMCFGGASARWDIWTQVTAAVTLVAVVILGSFTTLQGDAVMSVAAYWPGTHLEEFFASSSYSTCRDTPMPAETGILQHMRFDSKDNLWMTGQKSPLSLPLGLVEAAASNNYDRFETVDARSIGSYQPFVFDRSGNLWGIGTQFPGTHAIPLLELLSSANYARQAQLDVPTNLVALDLAIDGSDDLWIPGFPGGGSAAVRKVLVLEKKQGYAKLLELPVDCDIRQIVIGPADALFASVDTHNAVVKLERTDSGLLCTQTLSAHASGYNSAATTVLRMDTKGNLWVLDAAQYPNFGSTSSHVIELTQESGFSRRKSFEVPRRVFGLAVDRARNAWVTSPYKNVPYQSSRGYDSFRPEDLTRLDTSSEHSRQSTFVVPGWPFGVAVDRTGNPWITNGKADSNNLVELMAATDYAQKTFSVPGTSFGIAVDSRDNVWLAGKFPGYEVVELARDSGYRIARTLRFSASAVGIAFDPANNLWIADPQRSEWNLTEFLAESDYRQIRNYSVAGNLFGLAFDKSGNLLAAVAGCPGNRIAKLLRSANYLKEISYRVDGRPYAVAVDPLGNVWAAVAEAPEAKVTEFARSAGYAESLSFSVPGYRAFAIDSKGNVWIQSFDYIETNAITGVRRYPWRYR
jgi:streptogramin lyase